MWVGSCFFCFSASSLTFPEGLPQCLCSLSFSSPPQISWCSLSSFHCWHVWKDLPALTVHWLIQLPHLASFLLVAASTYWSLLWARVVLQISEVTGFVFSWPGTFSLSLCCVSALAMPSMQGWVCTLSVLACAIAFVPQGIWETTSTSAEMFHSHGDRSQPDVVHKSSSPRAS